MDLAVLEEIQQELIDQGDVQEQFFLPVSLTALMLTSFLNRMFLIPLFPSLVKCSGVSCSYSKVLAVLGCPSNKRVFSCQALCSDLSFYCSVLQFSSVTQSCPTRCDPMNRSTPGLPVHHQLPEFTQIHVHQVRDAIQPSHPLSSPSPPAPNLSL